MRKSVLYSLFALLLLIAGCAANPIITLIPSTPQAIDSGQMIGFAARVIFDVNNNGVYWSLSGPGLLTSQTATTATYVGGLSGTATVTAISVTNNTIMVSRTITVTASPTITTTTLAAGTEGQSYSQTVSVTGGAGTLTYSLSAGALPAGLSLSSSTGAITGTPTGPDTTSNFTVEVTDSSTVSPQSETQALSILINPAAALAVTTTPNSLPVGTVGTVHPTTPLTATGGIPPYTWTITSGALPPGFNPLTSAGQLSGTPTSAGTYSFTVQVTDSTKATATADLSIMVNAVSSCTSLTGKESLLKGDYAFVLRGFDSSGNPAFVGGVFTASGTAGSGNIAAGTLDMNLISGVQSGLSLTSTSTYNLGQDSAGGYRGCMSLVTSAGTQNYRFAVDSIGAITANVASNGHMIDFDATGPFTTGILRQASSSAFSTNTIAGNWAFGISGPKPLPPNSSGGKFAAVGVFDFSDGSLSGVADSNDDGKLDSNSLLTSFPATAGITLSSGSYSIGSNGRGTLTFTLSGNNSSPVDSFLYVVSASELLLMNSDSQTNNSAFTGSALKQSGTFSNSSLTAGTTDVLYDSGVSSRNSSHSKVRFGLIAIGSSDSFTYSGYQNDGSTVSSPTSDPTNNTASGTFSVGSDGRVMLTASWGGNTPAFYLSSANTGFFLDADDGASSGLFEPQSGSSFSNSSASGLYGIGSINPEVSGASDSSGNVTFTPSSPSVAGTNDNNSQGQLSPDGAISQTYSLNSTGVGLMPAGCALTGSSANCQNLLIVISSNKAVVMDVKPSSTTPQLTVAEQ